MEMLELQNLHKTFNPGTVNEKVALNGVSLTMEAGDFATIVGSNGAGKSTLFNAITGGFIADEGSISLGGENITFAPEYQRSKVIGHLFQDPLKGTAPNMTIEENLALAYLRAGTAPHAIFSRISRKDKEIFREKLALLNMGLEDRMKQPVGLLSGGQRQALTLLMATLVTPKLLLLDEHTAALDPATAEKVLELTKSIVAEKKITCLMVTHNMHQALELGNRTLMMDAGRIVFDVKGAERSKMTVDDLLEKFRENAGKNLDNHRILLSKVEKQKYFYQRCRMIKIAFFDVDGTLLKLGSKEPSPKTVQALQQLQANGVLLCMATGRGYLSIPHFEGVDFDIWLTFNGSYVRSKDTVLFKNPLDADDKHRILQNLKQMHRAAAISNEHFIVTNGTDPDLAQYFSFGSEKLVISEHFDALCEEEIYQIMCSCNSTEYAQILQGTHATQITAWWDKAVDIIPLSCGKGNAVRAVLAHYGFSKSEAIAFGDGRNDIEMLEAVGTGVAMGNALEEVKARAVVLCRSVEEDGVYHYCLENHLI